MSLLIEEALKNMDIKGLPQREIDGIDVPH